MGQLRGPEQTQVFYGGESVIAHQRLIREKRKAYNADADLFGNWWEDVNISRDNAIIREVDYQTAKDIILKYEWLGTMPSGMKVAYGLYFDGCLCAVECFTDSKAGSMYTFKNYPAICLARGAGVHWAPKWSASYLITSAVKRLDAEQYHFVIAYSDTDAGEIGTVYQACNWVCTGSIPNEYWESPLGNRFDRCHHRDIAKTKVDGKYQVIDNAHIEIKEKMLKDGWRYVIGGTRYQYVYPIGNKKQRHERMKILQEYAVDYPKREIEYFTEANR